MARDTGQAAEIGGKFKDDAIELIKRAYRYFNARDIDATLALLSADVDWPNGMEGGVEHGHQAVKNYWTRQWKQINPHVTPIAFKLEDDGRINVKVHQVVHDLNGKLLVDQFIHHVYTIKNHLVKAMEIQAGTKQ